MNAFRVATLLTAAVLALTGCSQGSAQADKGSEQRLASLAGEVSSLQQKVVKLQSSEDSTNLSVAELQIAAAPSAFVSTVDPGYGITKTKFGTFVVMVAGVAPYLDGFKVKLEIGNLTGATFNGGKIKVTWGWGATSVHSTEFDTTKRFFPGTFTDVEAVLTPATAAGVKNIFVSLKFNQLMLNHYHY